MDPRTGQRRQNDAPMHTGSNPRYQQSLHDQQQRRSFAGGSGDRTGYRPTPAPLSASNPGATARTMSGSAGYNAYYQESSAGTFPAGAMPQNTMGYHQTPSDYGQTDTRQSQGFTAGSYNPMMYNVQQAAGAQSTGVYDANSQFSRQPTAMHMMSTDVGGPYFPNEPASATVTATSAIQQSPASSSTPQTVYQQQAVPSYSSASMTNIGTMAGGASQQGSGAAEVSIEEDYPSSAGGLDEAYSSYQTALKEIFQNIRTGVLAAASDSLLNVSDWLLSHVAELGRQQQPPRFSFLSLS